MKCKTRDGKPEQDAVSFRQFVVDCLYYPSAFWVFIAWGVVFFVFWARGWSTDVILGWGLPIVIIVWGMLVYRGLFDI